MPHRFPEGALPVGFRDRHPRFEGRIKTTHGAGVDDIFGETPVAPEAVSEATPEEPMFAPNHDDVTNKIVLGATAIGLIGIIGGVAWHKIKQRRAGEE